MKSIIISLVIIVSAVGAAGGVVDNDASRRSDHGVERTVAADPGVTVTLCVSAGEITVRGWNKSEVRARSADAEDIELKRVDMGSEPKPAKRLDVFIDDKSDEQRARADCQASADVELDVPQGATVQVQTRDGDITIVGVEAAYAGSQNGDISIEHVAQRIEAGSIGGGISVKDSSGRVSLSSAGGGVEATNVSPVETDDTFDVVSVSGDIQLEKVSHAKLSAKSVTGNINLAGPLAHSGNYGFNTMSGDITLSLPADASFRLIAKLSQDGEINSDFPLTLTTETIPPMKAPKTAGPTAANAPPTASGAAPSPALAPPGITPKVDEKGPTIAVVKVAPAVKVDPAIVAVPHMSRRLMAVHGSGDASLTVNSFSGNLRLQKN